jgi:outer membrane protein OmpA-like peptidoglycan-associated protein
MRFRAAGALTVLFLALPAGAQAPEIDLSLFRPAAGSDGTLGVDGAHPLPGGVDPIELQLLLDGAFHPVRDPLARIDRRLGGWIAMQGRLDPRLSLFVQLPITLDANGDFSAFGAGAPGAGIGDLRVGIRGSILDTPDLAAGAHLALELATGDPQSFITDARAIVEALASVQRRLSPRLELLGNALVRFRPPRNLGSARFGNEIGLRGAASYLFDPRWRGYLELDARTSLRDLSVATAPVEWRVGVRTCAFGRVAFDLAAGTRLDGALGAPDLRALLSVRYAPAACAAGAEIAAQPSADALLEQLAAARALRDGLGRAEEEAARSAARLAVSDAVKQAENHAAAHASALRAVDERDTDQDGLPDVLDNCPFEKGPVINRGCPMTERQKVAVREDRIDILEKVRFKFGSAVIQRSSFTMLDQVAKVLQNHPDLVRIQVEGHTDSTGSARANTALSQARAEAVVAYLVRRGVDRARLVPQGFGPTRPLATNVTRSGREANRRVEFRVLDRHPDLDGPVKR